jgi:hypothetical protein
VLVGSSYRVQDWEYAGGGCRIPGISNVKVVLRLRGTSKLIELGLRYCANEQSIGFVDDESGNESPRRLRRVVG